jgi:hypothetical protein
MRRGSWRSCSRARRGGEERHVLTVRHLRYSACPQPW